MPEAACSNFYRLRRRIAKAAICAIQLTIAINLLDFLLLLPIDENNQSPEIYPGGFVRRSIFALAAAYCLIMSGCVSMPYEPYARQVKNQPSKGGVIAMHLNYRPEDKQRALGMMADNCGTKKPEVTEEGEVVVGQTTKTNDDHYYNGNNNQNKGFFFAQPTAQTASQSSVIQDKEWQMTYKCL